MNSQSDAFGQPFDYDRLYRDENRFGLLNSCDYDYDNQYSSSNQFNLLAQYLKFEDSFYCRY